MSDEYVPGSREIVAAIIDLWREEPMTESISSAKLLNRLKLKKSEQNWVLSEKRMKAALKEFNIQQHQPKFAYVKEITSEIVSKFPSPAGVQIQMSKGKGKALFATKFFREGDKLWEEEPIIQAGPVDLLRIMRGGKACAYCAKLLRTTPEGQPYPRSGIACINCTANWCSNHCKRLDIGHSDTHHDRLIRSSKPQISMAKWKQYEHFCLEESWNAGYLFAMVLLHKIKHAKTISKIQETRFSEIIKGMARIRQDTRQKAVTPTDSLEFEHYEQMWKHGYGLLAEAVKPVYSLDYVEYLEGLGMVNINNIRGCLFEVHANLNHNCEPNVVVDFKGTSKADGISVYARKDIPAGQELVTSYVNTTWGLDQRQYELRVNWGFNCACARCKRERQAKLTPLVHPIKSVLKSSPPQSPIDQAEQSSINDVSKNVHFDKNPVTLEISG